MATDAIKIKRVVSKDSPGGFYEINEDEFDAKMMKEFVYADGEGPEPAPAEPTVAVVAPPSNN
jgi:hypothetical protein